MTNEQFEALKHWVHRVAVYETGRRTHLDQRSVDRVHDKALGAERLARLVLVDKD